MSLPDRDTLLRRFSAWLDLALASENPPPGIPQELLSGEGEPAANDLYSVQAAVTALAQEVKLQGRTFKQLSETVAPLSAMAPELASLMEDARRQAHCQVLDALLDLRDRLAHGEEAARHAAEALRHQPRWRLWVRPDRRPAEIVAALRAGYELTAARLDEILESFDAREIECLGRAFDARSMHAIGTEETTSVDEGAVVEVCRRGYQWNGEVYRPAQVRVARRPPPGAALPGATPPPSAKREAT